MTRVAILGLGAMGRRMARRLQVAGVELRCWSRGGVPAELRELGLANAASPRAAAAAADVVISMVTHDDASRAVWTDAETGALAALGPRTVAIESSTLTPAWVAELAAHVARAGAAFLDAPVVGTRPQADAGALVYLVGGTVDVLERVRPVLSMLGSAMHLIGAPPAGTVAKLAVNALYGAQVAMLGELFGLVRGAGLEPAALLDVMATLPVLSPAAKVAGAGMVAGKFEPLFPIDLVVKDFDNVLSAARGVGVSLPVAATLREAFALAVARGLGGENITAIAKLSADGAGDQRTAF